MSKSVASEVEEFEVQSFLCIAGVLVISGLAALTAGLPLQLPGHQEFVDPASLDRGDTAWMMMCTIFGLFLSPAIAYFYSSVRNVTSTKIVQLVLFTAALITFTWILFTYSLCYGKDVNRFLGDPNTFYMFKNTYGQAATQVGASTIPSAILAVYELGFALAAPTIAACSLAGRVSTMGFLFFILVWHIAVYCPLAHMMWTNQGWFHQHYIEDFSGGLTVHMLSGLTAFCAHFFLGRDEIPHLPPVLNANETLKAAFLVWFLWFGYSAGKAHSAGAVASQAIVNIFASSIASVLISFFHELIYERNVTPISISTAIMLGLVGITPAAGYVTVGGAMCIGIFTYLVTMTVSNQLYLEGNTVNSPISVTTLHGLGGTVGFLCTAIGSYKFINPAAFDGATWGNGKPILYHFILTLLFYTCVTVSIFLILFICDKIVPLKSSLNSEAEYPDFSIVMESNEVNVPAEVTGATPRQNSMRMNTARLNSLSSSRLASGRMGVSRRLEMAVSKRVGMNRSAKSGLGNTDRTLSVGALGMNKSFRSNAMKDLELTQSAQI